MKSTIIPCPMCGALGEVGTQCLFCGMSIPKSEAPKKQSFIRFVDKSSVSAEAFAERISKYHNVSSFENPGVSRVRIGSLYGLINRNGDVVVPLRFSDLEVINGRWLLLCENDEYKLIDMLNWKPLNWKENYGLRDYDVKDGLDGQIIISRGDYRDRHVVSYDWKNMRVGAYIDRGDLIDYSERVFQPRYSIYDFKLGEVVSDGEGVIFPFEDKSVYQANYRYQDNDSTDYTTWSGYSPVDGKITSRTRFISSKGGSLAEISNLDLDEEVVIKRDAKGYFVIPKERPNDPSHIQPLYHRLDHLTVAEKNNGLHRFVFNPNLEEKESFAEFARFLKNEIKAYKDLNTKREKEKEKREIESAIIAQKKARREEN